MCVIPRRSFGSGICGNGGIGGTTKSVILLLIFPFRSASRVSCSLWIRTMALSRSFTSAMYSNRFWMYSFGYGRVRDNGAMSKYCGIILLWFRVRVLTPLLASPPDGDDDGFVLLVNVVSGDFPIEELPPLLQVLFIRNALMSRSDNFVIDFSFTFFVTRSSIALNSGAGSVFTGNAVLAEPSPEEVVVACTASAPAFASGFSIGEADAFDGCNEGNRTGSGYQSSGNNFGKCRQNLTSLSNMSSTTRCTLDPRCGASVLASVVYPAVAIIWVKISFGDTIVVVGFSSLSFVFALLLCAFCPRALLVPGGSNRPGEDNGVMRMLRMEPRFLVVEEGILLVAPPEIAAEEEEADNDCFFGCCGWRCIISLVLFLLVVVVVDAAAFVFGFGLVFCLEVGWGFGTFFPTMLALFSVNTF